MQERGVHFRSLSECVDTSTAAGVMMMQMIGSFAQFERAMIVELTQADAARLLGVSKATICRLAA